MSKLYLHKISTGNFKTTKDTIIADINKIRDDFRPKNFVYIDNVFHKNPKIFILKGGFRYERTYSNIRFMYFPVEKVLIESDIHTHRMGMSNFNKAKELEFGENVKYVEISNSFGLRNIENITIPFNIESFDNNYVDSDLKTITIKNNNEQIILEIDDIFDDVTKDILISNTDNNLRVSITSKYSGVYYDVYIKDNKLEYKKEFTRYEIKPNEEKVLDLPKLKEELNCKLIPNLKLKKEKIILTKDDYKFLDVINKNILKELVIKDENEMSLFPKTISINALKGIFKEIEVFDNKVYVNIEKEDKNNRYIVINDDLTYIDFEEQKLNKVYLDFDAKTFKLKEDNGHYNLTIPFYKDFNLKDSKILEFLVNNCKEIYVKNKEDILITKLFPTKDEKINIINIERNNKRNFISEHWLFLLGLQVSYNYDEEDNRYHKVYAKIYKRTFNNEIEHLKEIRKLLKK